LKRSTGTIYRLIITTLVFFLYFVFAFALKNQAPEKKINPSRVEYDLELVKTGDNPLKTEKQRMVVDTKIENICIDFYDSKGELSKNYLSHDLTALETFYLDSDKNRYMTIRFPGGEGKIVISDQKGKKKEVSNELRSFDGNGALFYILSRLAREDDGGLYFHLLQSREGRLVKMYMNKAGIEELQIGEKKVTALKYEVGLDSGFLSMFWPYKYYYWFDTKDYSFVRYLGPVGHDSQEQITVVSRRTL